MTARTPKGDACSHFFGIIELMKNFVKKAITYIRCNLIIAER